MSSFRVLTVLLAVGVLGCSADSTSPTNEPKETESIPTTTLVRVAISGSGQIAVRSTPSGLDCTYSGSGTSGICEARFTPGAIVELAAQEQWDGRLMQWSGGCEGVLNRCSLTVPAASGSSAVVNARVAQASTVALLTTSMTGLPADVPGDVRVSSTVGTYTLRSHQSQIFMPPGLWTVTVNAVTTPSGRMIGSGPETLTLVAGREAGLDIAYSADETAPVVSTVSVAPTAVAIRVDGTVQLTAVPKDAAGHVVAGKTPSWSTSNSSVAAVNATGAVTGVATGVATISATIDGKSGTSQITVSPAPPPEGVVASVTVSPSGATMAPGGTIQLTATLRDAGGHVLTGRPVNWASSNPNVASVSAAGMVTARAAGTAVIAATSEGRTGSAQIMVKSPDNGGQSSTSCGKGATWEGYGCIGTVNGVQFYWGTRWDSINKKYEALMRVYNGNGYQVFYDFTVTFSCNNGATYHDGVGSYLAAGGTDSGEFSGLWWYPCGENVSVTHIQLSSIQVSRE